LTDDKRSFREIYERFRPGVLRFLSHLVGPEEAEDVAQEVFLRVDRGLEGFRGESSLGTWIYTIARNAALDRLRSQPASLDRARQLRAHGSDEVPEDIMSQIPDEQSSLERYLIGKEMSECIRGRVDTLPESYRRVLVLSELAGMTNAEIASALGVSEGRSRSAFIVPEPCCGKSSALTARSTVTDATNWAANQKSPFGDSDLYPFPHRLRL
jgi:RNA polymerase sigma-70 factor (ECF subfamily)